MYLNNKIFNKHVIMRIKQLDDNVFEIMISRDKICFKAI
jgi:hypothetical protein